MKKKILSLILVMMLLPLASLFSACGKDEGYNLNKLEADFNKLGEYQHINVENNEIQFDYSSHNDLNNVLKSTAPYTQLENYNYVFYNIMDFASGFIDECSNNSATKNVKAKNNLQKELKNLNKAMKSVDNCVSMFAEIINISQDDTTATACLLRYENLLKTYGSLYESAINFTNSLTNLYYNHILSNANPNVYEVGSANFDANMVVSKIESRISYQRFNLSYNFVEMYVSNALAEEVANSTSTFNLYKNNYKTMIEAINKPISSVAIAAEKANNSSNKSTFYDLSVQAQNTQTSLANDRSKFVTACKSVEYVAVKNNEDVSVYQNLCITIIDGYYDLVKSYNNTLSQMLNIITN